MKFHMPLEHRKPQLYLYLVCLFSIWSDRTIELRVILWHQRRHRRQRSSTFSFSSIFSHSKANGILIADSWFEWIKFLFQFIRFRELSENQESNLKRKKSPNRKNRVAVCVAKGLMKFMYHILMIFCGSIDANNLYIFGISRKHRRKDWR